MRFVQLDSAGERGSQACKASVPFLEKHCPSLRLLEYVSLHLGEKAVICRVHAEDLSFHDTVWYDDTVTVCDSSSAIRHHTITLLKPASDGIVCVTVVAQDMTAFKRWSESSNKRRLEKMCHDCLLQKCIVTDSFVNLKHGRLGKAFNISGIFISAISIAPAYDSIFINSRTKFKLEKVVSEEKHIALRTPSTAAPVGGLDKEKASLQELLTLPNSYRHLHLRRPCRVLLSGPPGTGKTSLVTSLAVENQTVLLTLNGTEVIRPHPGESEENVRVMFRKAKSLAQEGSCILLIDELDALCPGKGKLGGSNIQAVSNALMAELDSVDAVEGLLVIAATNRPSSLDPSVRRPGRLDKEILLSVPGHEQRLEILKIHTRALPLAVDVDLQEVASITGGYVGADLAGLCQEAAQRSLYRVSLSHDTQLPHSSQDSSEAQEIKQQDFTTAFKLMQPSLHKGTEGIVSVKKITWDDIGGLQGVKGKIKQAVEWPLLHPEAFQRLGLHPSGGVLLYGPPGCSKTTLVRAAASSAGITFLTLSGAQLYSPFLGDSERLLVETFQKARALAPSILFLDELDAIVGRRSEGRHRGVQERVLSTLLNEMDGIGVKLDNKLHGSSQERLAEGGLDSALSPPSSTGRQVKVSNARVLVVAATNRPDMVDEAILRPGRIDSILYVPPPDVETRREILKVHTRNTPLSDVDLEGIAKQTEYYTGADLENICREAAMYALSESLDSSSVTHSHFVKALQTVGPSLSPELVAKYQNLKPSKPS